MGKLVHQKCNENSQRKIRPKNQPKNQRKNQPKSQRKNQAGYKFVIGALTLTILFSGCNSKQAATNPSSSNSPSATVTSTPTEGSGTTQGTLTTPAPTGTLTPPPTATVAPSSTVVPSSTASPIPSPDTTNALGVYYKAIDEKNIGAGYNKLAIYQYSLLHYNGGMYTSSFRNASNNIKDLNIDGIIGEKLKTVYGNHDICWSTNASELQQNTMEGQLYQVKGYDEDVRVCIVCEVVMPSKEKVYNLTVFDKLNDITLTKGEDLYKTRLHLEDAESIYYSSKRGEDIVFDPATWTKLSMKDSVFSEFMDAVFEAPFVDTKGDVSQFIYPDKGYPLVFTDSIGVETTLKVYIEGYVLMNQNGTDFLIKMDQDACSKFMKAIH